MIVVDEKRYLDLILNEEKIKTAIEYMRQYIAVEEDNEPVKCEFKEVMEILGAEDE